MKRRLLVCFGTVFGLALALPAVPVSAGGGAHCGEHLANEASTLVHLKANCFLPGVVTVPAGSSVRFDNADDIAHTVTAVQLGFQGFDLGAHQDGVIRFDQPGVYPYVCLIHPGMAGAVVVEKAGELAARPAVASRAADGRGDVPVLPFLLGGGLVLVLVATIRWRGATMRR